LEDPRRVVLLKDSAELDALPLGRHLVTIAVLNRRLEQGLGALLRLEVEPQAEAKQAVDARGVFHEAAAMQDPKLTARDVRSSIRRIEQQPARIGMERNRHGIGGEVPAFEVVKNHGGPNLGGAAWFRVNLVAARRNLGAYSGGEIDFGRVQSLIEDQALDPWPVRASPGGTATLGA